MRLFILVFSSLFSLSLLADGGCFETAYRSYSVEQAAQICRGVTSELCFEKSYIHYSVERAAEICRGVKSDICFEKAYIHYSAERAAAICRETGCK